MPMRRSGPGADLVGQEAALAGGFGGVGLGRAIMALGGVGQLGCEGGGLGRAGVVMLVRGRGEAQVGISGFLASWDLGPGAHLEGQGEQGVAGRGLNPMQGAVLGALVEVPRVLSSCPVRGLPPVRVLCPACNRVLITRSFMATAGSIHSTSRQHPSTPSSSPRPSSSRATPKTSTKTRSGAGMASWRSLR